MFKEREGLVIAVGEDENGRADPLTDNPEDVAGAKGYQAWLDSGSREAPNIWVLRSVLEAGITEVNGMSVADALKDLEGVKPEPDPDICQATAAMHLVGFELVLGFLEDAIASAQAEIDLTAVIRLIVAREVISEYGDKMSRMYRGPELTGDDLHDMFHARYDLFCPVHAREGESKTPENPMGWGFEA
jgi:hypothetical protein